MKTSIFRLCVLAALAAQRPALAQWYSVTDLTATGGTNAQAAALNNAGTLVGTARFGSFLHGFSYSAGAFTDLSVVQGGLGSQAEVVNDAGLIGGISDSTVNGTHLETLTVYSDGVLYNVGVPAGLVPGGFTAINASGEMVGVLLDANNNQRTVTFTPGSPLPNGTFAVLPLLPGGTYSDAYSINSSGVIVGFGDSYGNFRAVEYVGGAITDLNWEPAGGLGAAYAINDAGTIVGSLSTAGGATQEGVIDRGGTLTTIPPLAGQLYAIPTAINNSGTIVGYADAAGAQSHGFVYIGGVTSDLNALINYPSGYVQRTLAINDSGQILAVTADVSTLLLTPVVIHFAVTAPVVLAPGQAGTFTVTAEDASGNVVSFYNGLVQMASSDPAAGLPAPARLANGTGSFQVSLSTLGTQTVTAADTYTPSITGTSAGTNVNTAPIIGTQPVSQAVAPGAGATFTVAATGLTALSYQWTFNGVPIAGATGASYSVSNVQVAATGSYVVLVASTGGTTASAGAFLTVTAGGAPAISVQPPSLTIVEGQTLVLSVGLSGAGLTNAQPETARAVLAATYQWYLNGEPVANSPSASGAQTATLVLGGGQTGAGNYVCVVQNSAGSVASLPAVITLGSASASGRLTNVSCRAEVGTGASILITGFVIGGAGTSGPLPVLVRASGPALTAFSVSGAITDPELQLYSTASGSSLVVANTSWGGSAEIAAAAAEVGAFAWSTPLSHDSAILQTLPSGPYTANVLGESGDTGVSLAEVYDASSPGSYTPSTPRLVNVSSRVQVGTGSGILIAGFVIGGQTARTVLIRASGPALKPFQVTGTLADPELQLFSTGSAAALLSTNTGWGGNTQISQVAANVGAFSWGTTATADSALLVTLPPGSYTANVSGSSGDTGVALVEVYDVP